jgi:hypothetical protein
MFARIPSAFDQLFSELCRLAPGFALFSLFAPQGTKLLFSARRDACGPLQYFTLASGIGLGGFKLSEFLRVPGRELGEHFQFCPFGFPL